MTFQVIELFKGAVDTSVISKTLPQKFIANSYL